MYNKISRPGYYQLPPLLIGVRLKERDSQQPHFLKLRERIEFVNIFPGMQTCFKERKGSDEENRQEV